MIKITLITLGRLKEEYLRSAAGEYIKRLSRFCDLEVTELQPANLPENPTQSEIEVALKKEAGLIEKRIPKGALTVSLCVEGKEMTSEDFAQRISAVSDAGGSICFIVGSSHGICREIKDRSDLRLSLSRMVFPHQLFRVMLLEQLYRAFMINAGSNYHK